MGLKYSFVVILMILLESFRLTAKDNIGQLIADELRFAYGNDLNISLLYEDISQIYSRLPMHKVLSENPLNTLMMAENIEGQLSRLNRVLFAGEDIGNEDLILTNRLIEFFKFSELLPNDYISSKLGVDINSKAGLIAANVLRQYLSPLVLANDKVSKDPLQNDIAVSQKLISQVESLPRTYRAANWKNRSDYLDDLRHIFNRANETFKLTKIMDDSEIASIGLSLMKALIDVNKLTYTNLELYKQNIRTTVIKTEIGLICIGGYGDDTHTGEFALIIDLGGNDTYVFPSQTDKLNSFKSPCNVIVDLSGDDVYIGSDYSFGGAIVGVSLLLDISGNDSYSGGNFSLGSAAFGFGMLADLDGNDLYSSREISQGASLFGHGILMDTKGHDIYRATRQSQGFGFCGGFGILCDFDGSDSYISSNILSSANSSEKMPSFCQGAGLGFHYIAAGGAGLLIDVNGDDNYISDNTSQGFADYYSVGILADRAGNDKYQSNTFSQGCGANNGIGLLIDNAGNDVYFAGDNSIAKGFVKGAGILVDDSGDDKYIYGDLTIPLFPGSVSLLADLDKKGLLYAGERNVNFNRLIFPNALDIKLGIQTKAVKPDSALLTNISIKYSPFELYNSRLSEFNACGKSDSIFFLQCPDYNSGCLIDGLMPSDTLHFCEEWASAIHALFQKDDEQKRRALVEMLSGCRSIKAQSLVAEYSRYLDTDAQSDLFNNLSGSMDWRLRAASSRVLLNNNISVEKAVSLFKDTSHIVRLYASYSIGRMLTGIGIDDMRRIIGLLPENLNNILIEGFFENEKFDFKTLESIIFSDLSKSLRYRSLELLPSTKPDKKQMKLFKKEFKELPADMRAIAYISILNSDSKLWKSELKSLSDKGSDAAFKRLNTNTKGE